MQCIQDSARVVLFPPAKLNLFLEVLRKREDGFHALDTIMVETDLCDRLTLAPDAALTIECPGSTLPADEDNLVMRAARLLRQECGVTAGARMVLEKHVPMGAGLGGGSADCAATLIGLDRLWRTGQPPARLAELAARLGSDTAYFLTGGACRCTGRGEIVAPVLAGVLHAVVVYPGVHVPTPAVYRGGRIDLNAPRVDAAPMLRALAVGDVDAIGRLLFNRLEAVVLPQFPAVARTMDALRAFDPVAVRMSGSGSAVFALARNAAHATDMTAAAQQAGLGQVVAVKTVPTGEARETGETVGS